MSDDPGIRMVLHFERAEEHDVIEGWRRPDGGEPQRFEGWLELLTLLRDLDHQARRRANRV